MSAARPMGARHLHGPATDGFSTKRGMVSIWAAVASGFATGAFMDRREGEARRSRGIIWC